MSPRKSTSTPRHLPAGESLHVAPLIVLQRQINDDLEKFMVRHGAAVAASASSGTHGFMPNVNVTQTPHTILVESELAGITEQDVEVLFAGNVLTIQGERKPAQQRNKGQSCRREFSYGPFRRSLTLPENAIAQQAKAILANGMLTIELPVHPKRHSAPTRIRVTRG